MNKILLLLFIFSLNLKASEDCQQHVGLEKVVELSSQVKSICQGQEVELLKIDLDIGSQGWFKINLNSDGSIKSFQLKYDDEIQTPLSMEGISKGYKIRVQYPNISSKHPIEIGLKEGTIFDPQKGGELNLKMMMSPTPRNMLTGTRIKYYKNYPVRVVKENGQWKIFRKKSEVSHLDLKAKTSWTWDAAYKSVEFK